MRVSPIARSGLHGRPASRHGGRSKHATMRTFAHAVSDRTSAIERNDTYTDALVNADR